jgi:hypothetical protein
LAAVLKEHKVEHERVVYPGVAHNLHAGPTAADVNGRIEAWVRRYTTPKQKR